MLNFGGVFETTIHKIWLLQVVSFSAFIRACASHAMIRPRKWGGASLAKSVGILGVKAGTWDVKNELRMGPYQL